MRSQGEHSLCGGWNGCNEVIENVLHVFLSPAPSTVPSRVGAPSVCRIIFKRICLSQRNMSCPQAAASRSSPRNNIILRISAQGFLGSSFPPVFPCYSSPRSPLKEPARHVIPSFLPPLKTWLIMGRGTGQS